MTKKIDRRIRYHIVLDVETAGGLGNPLVYDVGFAITDRQGRIYETRSFMIEEIWSNRALMLSAYYSEKIPKYEKDIEQGKRTVVKFEDMRQEMLSLMKEYNVKVIGAYNLAFDMRALSTTYRHLREDENIKFLSEDFKDIELNCIWGLACQLLYTQKSFTNIGIRKGWVTEAGNLKTSAEIGYRYISGEYDFEESHTGLEDVLIEIEIMAYALRQNKKHEKGIINHPWRLAQINR